MVSRSVPAVPDDPRRPTLVVSVTTEPAAHSVLHALAEHLSAGRLDLVLVVPDGALSASLLRRLEDLRRTEGGSLQIETRPSLEQRSRPLPPPMSVARAAVGRSADGAIR